MDKRTRYSPEVRERIDSGPGHAQKPRRDGALAFAELERMIGPVAMRRRGPLWTDLAVSF